MNDDPITTNPDLYRVVMENDRVRVLEYRDHPGDRTTTHAHPDSVMLTMTAFRRRLVHGERVAEVELEAGAVRWLDAQSHLGENIGASETRAFFIELKEPRSDTPREERLGPRDGGR
jgi:beta-alanine degradation protein BauB